MFKKVHHNNQDIYLPLLGEATNKQKKNKGGELFNLTLSLPFSFQLYHKIILRVVIQILMFVP
jgi:hypothetical protein